MVRKRGEMMKLQSLELNNFRGVSHAILPFEGKSAVIYGINGMGKSTILQACNLLFFRIMRSITVSTLGSERVLQIEDSDIKIGEIFSKISMDVNIEGKNYHYYRKAEQNGKRVHSRAGAEELAKQIVCSYLGTYESVEEEENDDTDKGAQKKLVLNRNNMPIYALYGVNRYVADRINNKLERDDKLFGKLEAWRDTFDPTINFQLFFEWFRGRQELENSRKVEEETFFDPQLSAVRNAILRILDNDFSDIKIKISDEDAQMVAIKHNTELSIAQLSEGEKCILAMTGDLARKLAIANPSRENPLEGEGIVLIDEVDLHLHPSWQGRIMPLLFRTFPNVQFIVTTHSPKVLSEITDEAQIFEIYQKDDGIVVTKRGIMSGWDINHIMKDFMHTDILNQKTEAIIDQIHEYIDNEEFDRAEKLVDQLAELTSEMNLDVVRARTLIHRKR